VYESSDLTTWAPCAVERDARSGRGPEFNPSRGLVRRVRLYVILVFENDSYAHDDQGDNPGQATEGSTVSSIKCDRCWHLDYSSVKVLDAPISAEADRFSWDR